MVELFACIGRVELSELIIYCSPEGGREGGRGGEGGEKEGERRVSWRKIQQY